MSTAPRCAVVLMAGLLLSGVAGLTACSADSLPATGTSTIASSGSQSTEAASEVERFMDRLTRGANNATTYKLDAETTTTAPTGKVTSVTIAGLVDNRNAQSPAAVNTTTLSTRLSGHAEATVESTTELILVDNTAYWRKGASVYEKYDADTLNGLIGYDAFAPPAEHLRTQLSGAKTISVIGVEEVDGVVTTHYRVLVDVGMSAAALGSSLSPELTKIRDAPYDFWLDGEDNMRKFSATMTGATSTLVAMETQTRFGEPVTITAPPASVVRAGRTSRQA